MGDLWTWLNDFIKDRSQYPTQGKASTELAHVTCGAPQGSILGPILFSVCTNDLSGIAHHLEDVTIETYADDTTLYCISNSVDSTISSLSHGLALCAKWCNTNEMTIHPAKCEVMIISNTRLKGRTPQLTIKPGFHIITQDRRRSPVIVF